MHAAPNLVSVGIVERGSVGKIPISLSDETEAEIFLISGEFLLTGAIGIGDPDFRVDSRRRQQDVAGTAGRGADGGGSFSGGQVMVARLSSGCRASGQQQYW